MSKMKQCLYAVNCFRLILDSAVFVSFFGIMSLSVPRPAKRARGSQQVAHVNPMAFGMNPLIAGLLGGGGMGMNMGMGNFAGMGNGMGNSMGTGMGNGMGGMGSMANMGGVPMMNGHEEEEEEEEEHVENPAPARPLLPQGASSVSSDPSAADSNGHSGGELASEDFHTKMSPNCLISRSVTYVKNLPRNRISECLEKLSSTMEASYTAELSSAGLLTILWLYTRVKPSVKVTDLSHLFDESVSCSLF